MESEKVKEIKKGLEVCNGGCTEACPYHNLGCMNDLSEYALNLINELESENERLQLENKVLLGKEIVKKEMHENQVIAKINIEEQIKQENERLKNRIATLEYKLDAKESYYNAVKDRALEVFVQKIEAEIPDESTFGYLGYNGVMEVIDEKLKECLGK